VATYLEILERLDDDTQFVLDTRTPEEFAGTNLRATRGGHIPGSVNLPYQQNVDAEGKLKSLDELRSLYDGLGFRSDQDVVTVCHGGYRSAHTWMVLKLLGHDRVRSYVGSWQEWGDRIELPIER
jgi:thiosulfate/3-mercaptopyruvate sulfurtransferase